MQYRNITDMDAQIRANIHKIPHDIDVVVGVPRSGMLPASMIALLLNKRLADIDSFANGNIFECGIRGEYVQWSNVRKVLIVDDSIQEGSAIQKAKAKLAHLRGQFEFVYFVVYGTSKSLSLVDFCCEIINDRRIFEWNLFNHSFLEYACIDIDGVLNVDPTLDDDGVEYIHFLQHAEPLYPSTCPIHTLVSCRLEKYRDYTEKWLKEHDVMYQHLVLLDLPDKTTRVKWGKHGVFKGEIYKQAKECFIFIESSYSQAQTIANVAQKPVICIESNSILYPTLAHLTFSKRLKLKLKELFPRCYSLIKRAYYKLF